MNREALLEEAKRLSILEKEKERNPYLFYRPHAGQVGFHQSRARIKLLIGSTRCLAPEQKVFDPVLGVERVVSEIDEPWHVLAYNGREFVVAEAEIPFIKGPPEMLYEVRMACGGSFRASGGHIVLTPSGWSAVSRLRCGDALIRHLSSEDTGPSTRAEDAPGSPRTEQDSRCGCPACSRSCDGPPLQGEEFDPGAAPSRDGALGRTSCGFFGSGDRATRQGHSRPCPRCDHPSTTGDLFQRQPSSLAPFGIRSEERVSGLGDEATPFPWQCRDRSRRRPQPDGAAFPSLRESGRISVASGLASTSRVTSIRPIRVDLKWDFTVPVWHNYVAGGACHHNSGKTEAGAIEAWSHIKGFRPDGTKKGLPVPPTKGVILVQSFAKIVDPLLPKLKKYANPGWIQHVKNGPSGAPEFITFDNGSSVKIVSQVQPPTAADSADWDWGWADEPFEKVWWSRLLRGLADRNGPFWFTMSPIRCPWIYTDLYLKADGKAISVHEINLRDNPYLSPEGVKEYIERIPAEDRDAMIEGKFSHVKGRIFPEFDRNRHVIREHAPPPDAPVYMVMDPHDRRPSYLLWCYVDKRERLVAFEEWPKEPFEEMDRSTLSIRDYSTIIKNIEGKWAGQVVERIIDPRFGRTPSQLTGRTLIEEYEEYGLSFCGDIVEEITGGHQRIHALLGTQDTEPGLLICDSLRNLIWAFDIYSWKMEDLEKRNSKERPDDAGKDQVDVLRYLTSYPYSGDSFRSGGDGPDPADYGGGYG